MQAHPFARLAALAVLAWAFGAVATAMGQAGGVAPPYDPGYAASGSPAAANQFVSSNLADPPKDLEKRVKDLEAALKKVKDKEAADKKKAAGAPSVKVGGLVHLDSIWFGQDAASRASVLGDAQDTTYFRNARISVEGEGFCIMYYKMEIDFSGRSDLTTGTVATHTHTDPQGGITGAAGSHSHTVAGVQQTIFRDFYLGVKDLPYLGRVQVGHFKEPFGLEELTSDKFLCFTERGLAGAFTPARNMGVMAINNIFGENATWAAGLFRTMGDTPPYLADDRGFYSATARTTWLPWYDEATDGRGLLHVGGAYSYRDFADSSVRISQRPEVGAGPNVVDTRIAGVDALTRVTNEHLGGVEAALVYGPFSLQSEYMTAIFQRTAGLQEANFSGGYVYATFFLTGENRVYRRQTGTFDRIRPNTNFFRVRADDCTIETGWGAWEVGYRFSFVNLDNAAAAVYGGYAADHTIGVNWYLTPYMKVMADYVRSNASTQNNGPNVWIDAFVLRAAIDF